MIKQTKWQPGVYVPDTSPDRSILASGRSFAEELSLRMAVVFYVDSLLQRLFSTEKQ